MPNPKLQLDLPEPCHERWENMEQRDEQQRFCQSCERTLTDFSSYTDAQLFQFFQQQKGKLCGRFREDQLQRPLYGKRLHSSWWRALAVLSGLGISSCAGQAQTVRGEPTVLVENDQAIAKESPADDGVAGPQTITGVVKDEYGEPLIGATILVKETVTGTTTDFDGRFSLDIPDGSELLVVSYVGFQTKEYVLADMLATGPADQLTFHLEMNMMEEMLGVVVIDYHDTLAKRIRNWWHNRYYRQMERHDRREVRRAARKARRLERQAETPNETIPTSDKTEYSPQSAPSTYLTQLTVSPNPFTSLVSLEWYSPKARTILARLFDEQGRELWAGSEVFTDGVSFWPIPLPEHLPAATYFLHLEDEEGTQAIHTIIKQ